jgi:hypothetical protein
MLAAYLADAVPKPSEGNFPQALMRSPSSGQFLGSATDHPFSCAACRDT